MSALHYGLTLVLSSPSPLAGEGREGGAAVPSHRYSRLIGSQPPPRTPPHKGEGNRPRQGGNA
jgi:hypothetical protein